jgi:hypothetical protein
MYRHTPRHLTPHTPHTPLNLRRATLPMRTPRRSTTCRNIRRNICLVITRNTCARNR